MAIAAMTASKDDPEHDAGAGPRSDSRPRSLLPAMRMDRKARVETVHPREVNGEEQEECPDERCSETAPERG